MTSANIQNLKGTRQSFLSTTKRVIVAFVRRIPSQFVGGLLRLERLRLLRMRALSRKSRLLKKKTKKNVGYLFSYFDAVHIKLAN
jgi:hypothetical protein